MNPGGAFMNCTIGIIYPYFILYSFFSNDFHMEIVRKNDDPEILRYGDTMDQIPLLP